MDNQQDVIEPSGPASTDTAATSTALKKPYVAPSLEILDIEATRNSPGGWPDAGINYS